LLARQTGDGNLQLYLDAETGGDRADAHAAVDFRLCSATFSRPATNFNALRKQARILSEETARPSRPPVAVA
jgi:hypothetical protein